MNLLQYASPFISDLTLIMVNAGTNQNPVRRYILN